MLKNKKALYILIPLNILIWGFFVYRIFLAYNREEPLQANDKMSSLGTDFSKDSVNYSLTLTYQDPFLKKNVHTFQKTNLAPEEPVKQKKAVDAIKNPPAPPKNLPEIKYVGLIKNTSSGASTALVSVNGQSKLVKQNETLEGIQFKTFTRDSLVAKFGKDKIVVKR